jgi:5'(3')-deoxyribonucleotidase
MSRKLTILVDMDDTIEVMLGPWIQELNKIFNRDVKLEDVDSWDISKYYPSVPPQLLYHPLKTTDFWAKVKPKFDAPFYLEQLIKDGHDVYIVTSSYYDTLSEKLNQVLFKYFPFIPYGKVIVTSNKHIISGDVIVDDAPHNHDSSRKLGLLMDMPHNRNTELLPNMVRVCNWEQVYAEINRLCSEGG